MHRTQTHRPLEPLPQFFDDGYTVGIIKEQSYRQQYDLFKLA